MKHWIILLLFLLIGGVGISSIRIDRNKPDSGQQLEVKKSLDSLKMTVGAIHSSSVKVKAYELATELFPDNIKLRDYHAERLLGAWGY